MRKLDRTESIYLVIATSGRAIAQGLLALELPCAVIDGFADTDTQSAAVICKKVKRTRFGLEKNDILEAVDELQRQYQFQGLLYDAALEVSPEILEILSFPIIFGNSSLTLRNCINPKIFFSLLDQLSISYPKVCFESDIDNKNDWLIKEFFSTGGIGVKIATIDSIPTKNFYFQKKIIGTHFSLTFLADGIKIYKLGFNTLWNESLNDAMPYVYAGAINHTDLDQKALAIAEEYASKIAEKLELIGLNSIDFIATDNHVYVLEVNPRIPATYELYESKSGALLRTHMDIVEGKNLPNKKNKNLLRAHAILYATQDLQIPEKMSWPLWTADRPKNGELISQYDPICSVFAGGKNTAQVKRMIKVRKQSIIAKLN